MQPDMLRSIIIMGITAHTPSFSVKRHISTVIPGRTPNGPHHSVGSGLLWTAYKALRARDLHQNASCPHPHQPVTECR